MRNAQRSLRQRITEQAAFWYLEQREGADADQHAAFLAWLNHSPDHVAEYLAIARLDGDMKAATAMESMDAEQLTTLAATESAIVPLHRDGATAIPAYPARATPPSRYRPMRWLAAAGIAAMLLIGAAAWRIHPHRCVDVYTSTSSAGLSLELSDGSLLKLDRGSSIAVHFDAHRRDFSLLRGGVLIDVGKDPARPLRVTMGASVLRDIGTVFEARRQADGGTVTVISGRVDLLAPSGTWAAALQRLLGDTDVSTHVVAALGRGEQATVDGNGQVIALTDHTDIARATAWLPNVIRFRQRTVAEVARRFDAYSTRPLVIQDPAMASMRISGLFHAHDVGAFVAYLASFPGVRVQNEDDCIRILGSAVPAPHEARRL